MSDLADSISVERDGLRDMLERVALERENDAQAARDHRYAEAARSIRQIAATMHEVDDAALVKLSVVDQTGQGMLSQLVAARLCEVGFALPLYSSAVEFFAPIEARVDAILRRARPAMH